MRNLLKKKYISAVLLLLAGILFICFLQAAAQTVSPSLEPPEVILNGNKVIFTKQPILDEEGWLFPLEEIAGILQDKVTVDFVNGVITVQRLRDRTTIELNVKNGILAVNNRPFKRLFGYERIILNQGAQMVTTSALVMLFGLLE